MRALSPREWDEWRAYWRVRPREDLYMASAIVSCAVQASMVGGEPRIEDYYPTVARRGRREGRARSVSPERMAAFLDQILKG